MSLYTEYLEFCPETVAALENARAAGRFAHSFLVTSTDEKRRRDFVKIIAMIAGCQNVSPSGRPDCSCEFCRKVTAGIYSDMHNLTPVGKMYQIRVGTRDNPEPNTLRDMLDHLGYTSGNYRKFGVIHDADRMGEEAQNALLKTLEEPPKETTIILATANPSALLPTTRSRCQIINLPDTGFYFDFPGMSETCQALFNLCFSCGNDLSKIETAASALMTAANQLASTAEESAAEEFEDMRKTAVQSGDAGYQKRVDERQEDAAKGIYIRERRRFIAAISGFCSQIFMLSSGVDFESLPNKELFSGLKLPKKIDPERGAKILKEAETLEYTLKFNVNDELALRSFAINIAVN